MAKAFNVMTPSKCKAGQSSSHGRSGAGLIGPSSLDVDLNDSPDGAGLQFQASAADISSEAIIRYQNA
jgi:hypothetical protein